MSAEEHPSFTSTPTPTQHPHPHPVLITGLADRESKLSKGIFDFSGIRIILGNHGGDDLHVFYSHV